MPFPTAHDPTSLTELVAMLLRETDIPRLRFGSLEPWDLGDDFFDLFADRRLQPHLHLPLQSGSDRILRRMARRCRTEDFRRLVDGARASIPDLNVTTDLIVGFPGETENDWRTTLGYVESIGFGHLHIFPYSAQPGTAAAAWADQQSVDRDTKRRRVNEMHALGQRLKLAVYQGFLGQSWPVLWDAKNEIGSEVWRHWGYTPNFLRVAIDCKGNESAALTNTISNARLLSFDPNLGAAIVAQAAV